MCEAGKQLFSSGATRSHVDHAYILRNRSTLLDTQFNASHYTSGRTRQQLPLRLFCDHVQHIWGCLGLARWILTFKGRWPAATENLIQLQLGCLSPQGVANLKQCIKVTWITFLDYAVFDLQNLTLS